MNEKKFKEINSKAMIQSNESIEDYFKITECRIETDNGLQRLYGYQYSMLFRIINSKKTYRSNQSYALYGNYYFEKPRKIRKFEYNMILLENGEIYLHNITTSKFRRIHYKMEQKVSRKRKR